MEQCKLIRFSLQILTPAFHFKILDDFIDVFNEQSAVLARKLAVEVGSEAFNLFPYVTLCTLDIVCGESHAVQGEVSPQVSTNRLLIASQKPPWDARSTRRATASRSTSRRSMGKRKNRNETISRTEIQFGVGRGSCCAILRAVRATVSGSDMFPHTPISHYDLCVSARFRVRGSVCVCVCVFKGALNSCVKYARLRCQWEASFVAVAAPAPAAAASTAPAADNMAHMARR